MKLFDKIDGPGLHYLHPIWIEITGSGWVGGEVSFLSMQIYTGHHVSSCFDPDPIAVFRRSLVIGYFGSHDIRESSALFYTDDGESNYLKLDIRPRSVELSSWKGLVQSARPATLRWLEDAALAMIDFLGIPADQQFFRD